MALFKTTRPGLAPAREQTDAAQAVRYLAELEGLWAGHRRDRHGLQQDIKMRVELSSQGAHVLMHTAPRKAGEHNIERPGLDVWGLASTGLELSRTVFLGKQRQTSIWNLAELRAPARPNQWALVLESTSWDQGRPCELRYEFERRASRLMQAVSRRLINQPADFVLVSQATLKKTR